MSSPAADFPEKLGFLFYPARYKVAYGGRSASKSWAFARALLIQGLGSRLRILCTREVQKSIKDSVHRLLSDQIRLMRLDGAYEVTEHTIRAKNGTEFLFSGLSDQTIDSIKSYESIDRCWVEEGQVVSKRSWDILTPTIRADGSEIWVSFNPDLDTDETYRRFVLNPPPDCISVEVNYHDNPWFNDVMEAERKHCLATDPGSYENIWLGKCRAAVEGAIYHDEISQALKANRVCNIPYDPMLRVHPVFDLGFNDSLGCALVQRHTSEIRIIEYLEANRTRLDIYSAELRKRPYNWGKVWLPHDGFSGQLNSGGKSTFEILQKLGWKCAKRNEIVELSVEEGIKEVRRKFSQLYFDKVHCGAESAPLPEFDDFNATPLHNRLIECLKRYKRRINQQTHAEGTAVKDEHTHGADVLRYVCLNADNMSNEDDGFRMPDVPGYGVLDNVIGF